jgi:hypothetical protein
MHPSDRLFRVERQPIAAGKLHVHMRVRPSRLGNREAEETVERDRTRDILGEDLDDCRAQPHGHGLRLTECEPPS